MFTLNCLVHNILHENTNKCIVYIYICLCVYVYMYIYEFKKTVSALIVNSLSPY